MLGDPGPTTGTQLFLQCDDQLRRRSGQEWMKLEQLDGLYPTIYHFDHKEIYKYREKILTLRRFL